MGIFTVKHLRFLILYNLRFLVTGRTMLRDRELPRLREILPNLRDNHIGLINRNFISDSELQVFHVANIVKARSAHYGSLQLHRVKYRHGIDKTGSARRPFHLAKNGLFFLVFPLKGYRISRELGRSPETLSVAYIVHKKYQTVGGKIIFLDLFGKVRNSHG